MQVGNSVTSNPYTTYRNRRNVGYDTSSAGAETFSGAVTVAENTAEGEFPAITMIQEEGQSTVYGIMPSEKSTLTSPIVQVISNLGGNKEEAATEETTIAEAADAKQLLREKIEEVLEKIRNGNTEVSYQIGAESFTEEEWEELLEKFDSLEDMIRELMRERHKRQREAQEEQELLQEDRIEEEVLFAQSTTCTYHTDNPNDTDIRYITWYTEEGIFCRRVEQSEGYDWCIPFDNAEQYHKVLAFLEQFPEDCNMLFTSKQQFWEKFLKDEINAQEYIDYAQGKSSKIPEEMIINMSVVSLPSGVSLHFNENIGEMTCVKDNSNIPGGEYLWSRMLSEEERANCDIVFEKYPYEGHWEYRYGAYLSREDFWDYYFKQGFDVAFAIAALEEKE